MKSIHTHEPRPSRYAISQRIVLVRADGSEAPATITKVSRTGFRLKVTETLTIGDHVNLRGAAGDVPAQIQWALDNNAGGVFLRPRDD